MTFKEIITKCYAAYETKDRNMIEALLSDDFIFSSPDDPQLDKNAYFEKCWPFSKEVKKFVIGKLIDNGNEGFASYKCETIAGKRFTNAEFFSIKDDKINRVEVYYGRTLKEKE